MNIIGPLRHLAALLRRGLVLFVRLYQVTLSPLLGGQCRFVPTCSVYFIGAVETHGAVCGTLMGLWRILRCNPLSKGGFDPVK
jgi:putative membrane protein insertion efficiency factor